MAHNQTVEKTSLESMLSGSSSLESMLAKISIPPIPANRLQLLDLVRQPKDKINLASLTKLVNTDPALFAMVLKLANSAYYRGVEKVINLRSAMARIGLSDTIDSISFFCIQNTLPPLPAFEDFSAEEYWKFSWACAMAARRLGHPNLGMKALPGELYMAGLLHGIGRLMMAIHYPDKFEKCLAVMKQTHRPAHEVEQEIFGTLNGFLASEIMKFWNFPDHVCAGVNFYQIPESAPPECQEMAGLIQFAYILAAKTGIGDCADSSEMDLTATYIGQQPHLSLSRQSVQINLIKEMTTTLGHKYQDVTGQENQKNAAAANNHARPQGQSPSRLPQSQQLPQNAFARFFSFLKKLIS